MKSLVELFNSTNPTSSLLAKVSGFVYVALTAAGSIVYLYILSPSITNDHWWPNFNTTGAQTFLGDLYNAKLTTEAHGDLDLFASNAVVFKNYGQGLAHMSTRPGSARAILLGKLPLNQVVGIIRSESLVDNIRTLTPSCWLDFNRTYEMAHTARHQEICNERRKPNAAVYLEALLRNIQSADLLTSSYYPEIQSTIFNTVAALTSEGAQWVNDIEHHTWLPVDDEVRLWTAHGLEYFKNQLQNLYQEGIQDTIAIVNALGIRQRITIMSIPYLSRPKGAWTSGYSFCGFWNDLDAAAMMSASLIRSAPNWFESTGYTWDNYYCGSAGTPATVLVRSNLGPLTVIDIFVVPPPSTLVALVAEAQKQILANALQNSQSYVALIEPTINAVPTAWVSPGAVYYGGNPVCPYGLAQSFVQPSFGYYDDCGSQEKHIIQMYRDSVLFALLATSLPASKASSVCNLASVDVYTSCIQTLLAATNVVNQLIQATDALADKLREATRDVVALNTTFVQLATINGTDQVLLQPMVTSAFSSTPSWDPWSFVGWMTMYEWINGQREVLSFEGDYDTFILMSRHHDFVMLAANAIELPRSACTYLWFVCIYVSAVLLFVFSLLFIYGAAARFHVDGRNLFFSNRLIGGAWIGRPFLFLRGMTAILVLSTSPSTFRSYGGLTTFDFTPRPAWHSLVIAGEVAWITYVVNDILLPATQPYSTLYAPLSSILCWLVVFFIEYTMPYVAQATIGRDCEIISFMQGLQCNSGEIHIGSTGRTGLLLLIALGSVVVAFLLTMLPMFAIRSLRLPSRTSPSVLLTSTSEAFLFRHPQEALDATACVLSGILPLGDYVFDVKNWIICKAIRVGAMLYSLAPATCTVRPMDIMELGSEDCKSKTAAAKKPRSRWVGLVGLVWLIEPIVTSFLFFDLSRSLLTNDFMWAEFDVTTTLPFVANWFNINLQFSFPPSHIHIDAAKYGTFSSTTNETTRNVINSALYAIQIQDEANSLSNVVQGLRMMDGCLLPWISTAYCFADFNQTWEMAHSDQRQKRCLDEKANGAVHLEAILRNADWSELEVCWGDALDIGIFSSLRSTNRGLNWIAAVKNNVLSVREEVDLWQSHDITRFTTQWQNYKSLGVTESLTVSNPFGLTYPLTLKKSNSSFHVSAATSMKMYWSFANDLTSIASNTSILSGKSLLRQSALYGFQNISIQMAMAQRGILILPLDPALTVFNTLIGPFGTVDMKRVAVPTMLRDLYQSMRQYLLTTLNSNPVAEKAFWSTYTLYFLTPIPQAWNGFPLWGGDINCGVNFGGSYNTPFMFFSSTGLCGNYLNDFISDYSYNVILAVMAANLMDSNDTAWQLIKDRDPTHSSILTNALNSSTSFLTRFVPKEDVTSFDVESVQVYIRDDVGLELIQYLSYDQSQSVNLSRINLFAPTEPDFYFFSWIYLFSWVEGKREVVTFQADLDAITTISTVFNMVERTVGSEELPTNLSFYFYNIVLYISIILGCVGLLACVYIVSSRGYIEGKNMEHFSLVAGHVWVGRPLVLLRGLAAAAFLATSRLNLIRPNGGLVAYLESPNESWLLVILSAAELGWLVNIIHDTCSVFTREFTAQCFSISTWIVCGVAAIWTFAAPAHHAITISRECRVLAVDFDVECLSGVVEIGSFSRFRGLIGVSIGGCALGYLLVRIRHRWSTPPPKVTWLSFFLYSAAKHKFERTIMTEWEHRGVYYLDKASAALTGLIALQFKGASYILDIKTWRIYVIDAEQLASRGKELPAHILHALPLVE